MPMKHMKLHDRCILRERVFVNAEAIRIGEIVGKMSVKLEDVFIAFIPLDGNLCL